MNIHYSLIIILPEFEPVAPYFCIPVVYILFQHREICTRRRICAFKHNTCEFLSGTGLLTAVIGIDQQIAVIGDSIVQRTGQHFIILIHSIQSPAVIPRCQHTVFVHGHLICPVHLRVIVKLL